MKLVIALLLTAAAAFAQFQKNASVSMSVQVYDAIRCSVLNHALPIGGQCKPSVWVFVQAMNPSVEAIRVIVVHTDAQGKTRTSTRIVVVTNTYWSEGIQFDSGVLTYKSARAVPLAPCGEEITFGDPSGL